MSCTSNKNHKLVVLLLTVAMIFAMFPTMSAFADELPTPEATASFSNATDIAAGSYEAAGVETVGGTGKVKIECKGITIREGKAYGKILFTSKTYPAFSVNVDGSQSQYVTTTSEASTSYEKGTATAEIPVALNKEFEMSAYSSKMRTWIKYRLTITLNEEASKECKFTVNVIKTDGKTESNALDEAKLKLMSSGGAEIAPDKKSADNYEYKLEGEANLTAELNDDYEVAVKNAATGKWESTGNKVFNKVLTRADDKSVITITFLKKQNMPVLTTKLTKGVYNVTGDPKKTDDAGIANTYGSKMFRVVKATLTVADNGKPVFADIYLSGVGYDALYVGKMVKDAPAGAIAAGNPDKLYTSAQLPKSQAFVGKDDAGKLHFVIPVSEFDEAFDLLAKSVKFDQWSHKKLSFAKDKLVKISGLDPEYDVLEGKELDLKQGDTATIRVDAEYSDFHEVLIDGEVLDSTKYTSKSGSTIVSINTSGLAVGTHTVTMTFANGRYATSTINLAQGPAVNPANPANPVNPGQPAVNPAQPANPAQPGSNPAVAGTQAQGQAASRKATPNTGDSSDMQLMTLILLASLTSAVAVYRKKSAR